MVGSPQISSANLKSSNLQICISGSETLLFSLQIRGLTHQGNLRINHYKFADLRNADRHISEICGFVIAECAHKYADLPFTELQKKICVPTFAYWRTSYDFSRYFAEIEGYSKGAAFLQKKSVADFLFIITMLLLKRIM